MKTLLLLSAFLVSTTAWANVYTWDELETDHKYSIVADIPITDNVTLKADSPLYFKELIAGDIPVMLFSFQDPNCTNPEFESDLALFNPEPEDTDHDKTIGIQFSKECAVDVYVEPQYYYSKSIFKD